MAPRSADLTLEITRLLPAGAPIVFGAFSDPNQLAEWWGPRGFTVPSLEFDPRVGELFRIEMQPPDGDRFHLAGEFREVDSTHSARLYVRLGPARSRRPRDPRCPVVP